MPIIKFAQFSSTSLDSIQSSLPNVMIEADTPRFTFPKPDYPQHSVTPPLPYRFPIPSNTIIINY